MYGMVCASDDLSLPGCKKPPRQTLRYLGSYFLFLFESSLDWLLCVWKNLRTNLVPAGSDSRSRPGRLRVRTLSACILVLAQRPLQVPLCQPKIRFRVLSLGPYASTMLLRQHSTLVLGLFLVQFNATSYVIDPCFPWSSLVEANAHLLNYTFLHILPIPLVARLPLASESPHLLPWPLLALLCLSKLAQGLGLQALGWDASRDLPLGALYASSFLVYCDVCLLVVHVVLLCTYLFDFFTIFLYVLGAFRWFHDFSMPQ